MEMSEFISERKQKMEKKKTHISSQPCAVEEEVGRGIIMAAC